MRTLNEVACSSVGGGAQDPKVTGAGAGLMLVSVEVGKLATAAASSACGFVLAAPAAACGGYLIGTYIEEQSGIGSAVGDWVGTKLGNMGFWW